MKKKLASIIIFLFVLVFPVVTWPALVLLDKAEVNENRNPTPFPEFSNEFITEFDKFLTDHAPLRNSLIKMYSGFENWTNKVYQKMLKKMGIPYYYSKNNVLFGDQDWLFFLGDKSLDYYRGTNLPSEAELASYVAKAEKVNNYLTSQGKQFKIFIAPNKDQIYSEFMPEGISVVNQTKRADVIVDYFKKHSNVEVIYPKKELLAGKDKQQVYYKYDTHWNTAGAYYGTLPLLKSLGIEAGEVSMTPYTKEVWDLLLMIAAENKPDIEFNINYRPEYTMSIKFENDNYITSSSNTNGKSLLLLGDSFRTNMAHVLGKEYTTTTLGTRSSYCVSNNYEDEIANADTIVFECVERYEQYMFGNGDVFDRFIAQHNL